MPSHTLTLITVTYNSRAVIGGCLSALAGEFPVIVVDNASTDGTAALVREKFPQVTLIENTKNVGFGCANNQALEKVQTPFALLLNPDARLSKDDITMLLHKAQTYPDAAILCPLQKQNGEWLKTFRLRHHIFTRNRAPFTVPDGDCCTETASGAVMLWNMAHMHKVGFFDKNIFLFFEDDDICLRARHAGFSILITPEAVADHPQGTSSGTPSTASILFRNRHYGWAESYFAHKHTLGPRTLPWQRLALHATKALLYALSGNRQKAARAWGRFQGATALLCSH